MLQSSLPLPASFFKVLPLLLPQTFNHFRFHILGSDITFFKSLIVYGIFFFSCVNEYFWTKISRHDQTKMLVTYQILLVCKSLIFEICLFT